MCAGQKNNFVRRTFISFEFIVGSHQHSELRHMTSVKCAAAARRTSDDVSRALARGRRGTEQQQRIFTDSF